MKKLGLIAGGGGLPVSLANHCQTADRPFFVLRLKGFAAPEMARFEGVDLGVAQLGRCFRELRAAGCEAVCLAGTVARPDFSKLGPDWRGLAILPQLLMAARKGDDALLSTLVRAFEKEGFEVEGAHQVMGELTLPAGVLGLHSPSPSQIEDIERALLVARTIGRLDVGQAAVCCDGLVLAVEAQEGTDAMLRRVADLPEAIRGVPGRPRGVLAKASKPQQERRVDLPVIGLATLQMAARAGLAGIAGEAGRTLLLDRDQVLRMADDLGLFLYGASPEGE
jgi:DUF1009 family protein